MLNLNGENVQKAWDDYKGFLEGLGEHFKTADPVRNSYIKRIEQAFKMGYAMGEASNAKAPTPAKETEKPARRKRTGGRGKLRTPQQMQQDARLVASILQRNAKPMQLQEVLKAVNEAGANWNEKSASGFMSKVMETQPAIKKIGYGMYEYQQ